MYFMFNNKSIQIFVKRHYETNHYSLFNRTIKEQKSFILQVIKSKNLLTNTLLKFVGSKY